jgi:(E)-4-hydroxy-3-methylbut-2-enyl-diphosphate synthase
MINTDKADWRAAVRQIKELENVGCEIVRMSVPDMQTAQNISKIKKQINIPLVADIHFDYKLAIESIKQGIDKLRINPGNIGDKQKVLAVVKEAKSHNVPIRIGVNAGSLKAVGGLKDDLLKAKELARAAMEHVKILESCNFEDIVVSLKASDVKTTILAYEIFAQKRNYPLHLGITEAGSIFSGTIKSAAGLGIMLDKGLGDTLRVSLTADPVEEVKAGFCLLQALQLRNSGLEIISCPTCSRCQVDLIKIVAEVEREVAKIKAIRNSKKKIKAALMGCAVNGPGEAKDADFGIAGGKGEGLLFIKGQVIKKVKEKDWVKTIRNLIVTTIAKEK